MKNKDLIFEELREKSLEDVYDILYKNKPHRNSLLFDEWDYLESVIYEELLDENENIEKCNYLIEETIEFLKLQWNKGNKRC